MAVDQWGTKNEPIFLATGAPEIDVDPTAAAAYAAKVGNHRAGTQVERVAATGADVWDGLLWSETDTGDIWQRRAGGWVAVQARMHGRARRSTVQSIPSSGNPTGFANTAIVFDTQDHAVGVTYGTSGFTILGAGLYAVRVRASISSNATGYRYLTLKVNGAVADANIGGAIINNSTSHSTDLSGLDVIPLAAGDTIGVDVGQASGTALNLLANAQLEVVRIGPKDYTRF